MPDSPRLHNPTQYPDAQNDRDSWVLAQRTRATGGGRNELDPSRPYAFMVEDERAHDGSIVPVATVFLTNRECPWRCLMCDLWQNTLTETLPAGKIPEQITYALDRLDEARQIKLYNSGSFFDRKAIPVVDYPTIARQVDSFERVIVESHPALIGDDCFRFRDLVSGRLEVAMGLETVDPAAAPQLNKKMTLDSFADAADRLRENEVDLRVFILVTPPFTAPDEALYWASRSVDFAFDIGASLAILIPTRAGNGAMEALQDNGDFSPPSIATLEAAATYGVALERGRVFVDAWDLGTLPGCPDCLPDRTNRLISMNLHQQIPDPVSCHTCQTP